MTKHAGACQYVAEYADEDDEEAEDTYNDQDEGEDGDRHRDAD